MTDENTTPTPETPAVETPAAPAPGTPEYNAQMAAEGAAAMGDIPAAFRNEDGTPNVEAMAQAIQAQGTMPAADATPEPVQEVAEEAPVDVVEELRVPDEPEPAPEPEAPKELITQDEMQGYVQEIMAKGDISDQNKTDLMGRGIPESLITSMVEGHRARMQQQFQAAGEIVGGSDRLQKIFNWAAQNLSPEQRAGVNQGLASASSDATLLGLAAMYDKAEASAPKKQEPREAPRYSSNPTAAATIKGFTSKAEYYAAAQDPKMTTDPKFRAEVEARMVRTDWTTLG